MNEQSQAQPEMDPRMVAGIKLIERTGARQVQIRYSDDEQPVVWMAVGRWSVGEDGVPVASGGREHYEVMAATDPAKAVMRLADQMIDGGLCPNCHQVTTVVHDERGWPLDHVTCAWTYSAERHAYVRGCDGKGEK
jgi:hypothetical protein